MKNLLLSYTHELSTPSFPLLLFSFTHYKTRSCEIPPRACTLCSVISLRYSSVLTKSKLKFLKKEQYKPMATI